MNCKLYILLILFFFSLTGKIEAQETHSVARQWNEVLLHAIRHDLARPTVHARNLFHTSVAMYDAWAVYDEQARPFLLGQTVGSFTCPFNGVPIPADRQEAREEAISYAAYRLIKHRFRFSPGAVEIAAKADSLFLAMGYDATYQNLDAASGGPAALGNYIADCLIKFGFQDGSNEFLDYENLGYAPVNPPLEMAKAGNPAIIDPNRWQPLTLEEFVDQAGNPQENNTPDFLGAEWGRVLPFALSAEELEVRQRDNTDFYVYHDPGPPPYLDTTQLTEESRAYQWGFLLVALWSAQLDPADGIRVDISPAAIGNQQSYPQRYTDYPSVYRTEGGMVTAGHTSNPYSGTAYSPNEVPMGDYTRVLAEFWADGPDSETPPGHWFTILNTVNDNPALQRKYKGEGADLDELEWDVKAYLMLGGAMHDAAISAWGLKGWYDYIRPVSAIRAMADYGQSSEPGLPNYHPAGLPLVDGRVELIEMGDPLAGDNNEHLHKIKLKAWRGPAYITFPETDVAGVGWIRAEDWWPYQRPTFVTPPFAGYVSGHSTYSRAAAEVLTFLTGDAYFPGGFGEFIALPNDFLVFEDGPSEPVFLQWATYRDAADQSGLSRIWGGIHPPTDDMVGRLLGEKVGVDAALLADAYFRGDNTVTNLEVSPTATIYKVYPNPSTDYIQLEISAKIQENLQLELLNGNGQVVARPSAHTDRIRLASLPVGVYWLRGTTDKGIPLFFERVVKK